MNYLDLKKKLTGVFSPIVTPFDDQGNIEFKALKRNIEKLNQTNLRGYFVLGTNGEFRSLDDEEKIKVVKTVAALKGEKVIIAGASCESTIQSVKLANKLSKLDVDFISLLPPSFFAKRMEDDILYNYFSNVADSVDKPVLLYNNPPAVNNICLSTNLISKISKHENVFGVKDTSKGNYDSYITSSLEENFWLLAGTASFMFPALILGAVGGVLSLANVFPELCLKLFHFGMEKDVSNGLRFHRKMVKLNSMISGKYGVSGVKGAMDLFGFEGLNPRKPLLPLNSTQKEQLEKEVKGLLDEFDS